MSVILAIDLGKFNSVFCWLNENFGEGSQITQVVIEACSRAD